VLVQAALQLQEIPLGGGTPLRSATGWPGGAGRRTTSFVRGTEASGSGGGVDLKTEEGDRSNLICGLEA
jgi:hypothetical protein